MLGAVVGWEDEGGGEKRQKGEGERIFLRLLAVAVLIPQNSCRC